MPENFDWKLRNVPSDLESEADLVVFTTGKILKNRFGPLGEISATELEQRKATGRVLVIDAETGSVASSWKRD